MMGLRGKSLFWVVAFLVAALDLGTKSMVFSTLGVDAHHWTPEIASTHSKPIIDGTFMLVAQKNPGMMWGMLNGYSGLLRIFRFVALGVIIFLFLEADPRHKVSLATLGGILGGAVGNIYDSLTFGGVRDFLHFDFGFEPFHPWPAFNVADSAICVGVISLALTMVLRPHSSSVAKPAANARAAAAVQSPPDK